MGHVETVEYSSPIVVFSATKQMGEREVWSPDVEMPLPFAPHHLIMASLYTRGYSIPEIAEIIGKKPNYCVKLFNDYRNTQSMPYKIREATGYTPKSTVLSILWMAKHKFLEPLPGIHSSVMLGENPFTPIHLDIMREYLGGNTAHPDIAKKVFLSEGSVRNYFSTQVSSIRTVISRSCKDGWWAPNNLSAGYWMVSHGYLPASVIGEQLP